MWNNKPRLTNRFYKNMKKYVYLYNNGVKTEHTKLIKNNTMINEAKRSDRSINI